MKEIKPTYVTFEQAKWLKEKGFNEECFSYYSVEYSRGREIFFWSNKLPISETYQNSFVREDAWTAPEQWQVVEWLRVNHGIWVESLHRGDMGDFIFKVVELNENNWKKHPHYIHNEGFNSPQEAYSAAFDYIKDNNLI
jgi:hypothetical protein